MSSTEHELTQEDVTKLLIKWLRQPQSGNYSSYGDEIYLPALASHYRGKNRNRDVDNQWFKKNSSLFYDAAWELCRRGILRSGITEFERQATADGASGNG